MRLPKFKKILALIYLFVFLGGVVSLVTGGIKLSNYYSKVRKCKITDFVKTNCYQDVHGDILELYFIVDNNHNAFVNCGQVTHCNKSCPRNFTVGNEYYCEEYNSELQSNSGAQRDSEYYRITTEDHNKEILAKAISNLSTGAFNIVLTIIVAFFCIPKEDSEDNKDSEYNEDTEHINKDNNCDDIIPLLAGR